ASRAQCGAPLHAARIGPGEGKPGLPPLPSSRAAPLPSADPARGEGQRPQDMGSARRGPGPGRRHRRGERRPVYGNPGGRARPGRGSRRRRGPGGELMADAPLIALRGVTKVFGTGPAAVRALAGIDLDVGSGEFVAIMGPSGSGKSTAMNILGLLDTPTSGAYYFKGVD